MSKKLLIIGKPHSSKTVFITQFYTRLQKGKSKLSLYEPVDDLSGIIDAKDALARGDEPEPTDAGRNISIKLPLLFNNEKVDLYCPDYGGEQINQMLLTRQIPKNWTDAINESNNWIFFLRLNGINKKLDVSNITVTKHHTVGTNTEVPYHITEQSSLIELLQILMHFKKHDFHVRDSSVKITIALTCWDELNTVDKPRNVLLDHLPLLLDFIESNWNQNNINYIGLSALGFPLSSIENKEKYAVDGSENFGFLIYEDGTKTTDITELVATAF